MAILMSAFSEAASSSEEEEEVGGGSELSRGGKFTVGEQIYQGNSFLLLLVSVPGANTDAAPPPRSLPAGIQKLIQSQQGRKRWAGTRGTASTLSAAFRSKAAGAGKDVHEEADGDEGGAGELDASVEGPERENGGIPDQIIERMCEIMQEDDKEDFSIEEAVDELVHLCPGVQDRRHACCSLLAGGAGGAGKQAGGRVQARGRVRKN